MRRDFDRSRLEFRLEEAIGRSLLDCASVFAVQRGVKVYIVSQILAGSSPRILRTLPQLPNCQMADWFWLSSVAFFNLKTWKSICKINNLNFLIFKKQSFQWVFLSKSTYDSYEVHYMKIFGEQELNSFF